MKIVSRLFVSTKHQKTFLFNEKENTDNQKLTHNTGKKNSKTLRIAALPACTGET